MNSTRLVICCLLLYIRVLWGMGSASFWQLGAQNGALPLLINRDHGRSQLEQGFCLSRQEMGLLVAVVACSFFECLLLARLASKLTIWSASG